MSIMHRLKKLVSRGALDVSETEEVNQLTIQAETSKKPKISSAFVAAASVGLAALLTKFAGIGAPAAAEMINTTAIVEMITSMTTIFPSMGTMVVAIVPTLLILAIVAFLLGFFDSILDAIQGAMKFTRR